MNIIVVINLQNCGMDIKPNCYYWCRVGAFNGKLFHDFWRLPKKAEYTWGLLRIFPAKYVIVIDMIWKLSISIHVKCLPDVKATGGNMGWLTHFFSRFTSEWKKKTRSIHIWTFGFNYSLEKFLGLFENFLTDSEKAFFLDEIGCPGILPKVKINNFVDPNFLKKNGSL